MQLVRAGLTIDHMKSAISGQEHDFGRPISIEIPSCNSGAIVSRQTIGFALAADNDVGSLDPELAAAVVVDRKVPWHRDQIVRPPVLVEVSHQQSTSRIRRSRDVELHSQARGFGPDENERPLATQQ